MDSLLEPVIELLIDVWEVVEDTPLKILLVAGVLIAVIAGVVISIKMLSG